LFPFYLRTRLYGLYKTAWKRLKNRQDEGIWDRIFKALAYPLESMGMLSVDNLTVEAKKGGAGGI
jgi:hypothetical protein